MTDKALLVGINAYPGAPLAGCVNDVTDMAAYLTKEAKFDPAGIRLLVDARATKAEIETRLKWLVKDAKPGDRLVFHYSGHGTQVADRTGDEIDGLDEVICLAGDTKIPLLSGEEKTIASLAESSEPFWVYSMDESGNVRPGRAVKAWQTSQNAPLLRITLDNGESVRCTPEHLWLMRDGSYQQAQNLKPGDSLMPLYRHNYRTAKGRKRYEESYNPSSDDYIATHKFVAGPCPKKVLKKAEKQGCGVVVHHIDLNHRNNQPENLVWMTWHDHATLHKASPEAKERASARSRRMWADPRIRAKLCEAQVRAAHTRWSDPAYRDAISTASSKQDLTAMREGNADYITGLTKTERSERARHAGSTKGKRGTGFAERMRQQWADPAYREQMCARQSAAMKKRWADPEARKKLGKRAVVNHKVVSVTPDGEGAVYDISVPAYQNFAVSAGVFLHNCPVDFDWTEPHLISDDYFAEIFKTVPAGVKFAWIADCCHSGTLTRDFFAPQDAPPKKTKGARILGSRFLKPPADHLWRLHVAKSMGLERGKIQTGTAVKLNVQFVSGCKDTQTSADATFGRRANGALTYYLLQALKAKKGAPFSTVVAATKTALAKAGFDQVPQSDGALLDKPFLG